MKNILLVGCGNIGSRHLESLVELNEVSNITIVEPNEKAKINALNILKNSKHPRKNLNWISNITELKDPFDFTIVATQSIDRHILLNKLLEKGNKKFLIEKIVCQSNNEYQKILNDFKKFEAKGWVNTNFRYFSFYQKLLNFFFGTRLKFEISGGEKGLGSNAIHFLDLFSWFINSSNIILNGELLDDKLLPNKRNSNLIEFSGMIYGKNNDSTISIKFVPSHDDSILVEILNSKHHIIINTTTSQVSKIKGLDDFSEEFRFQHTSELTKKIVHEILETDSCSLPTLDDLFLIHSELFRIFNLHIKKLQNKELKLCPIT